jgi:DNA repair exonuclease SbcCD ATPase subunit
MSDPGGEVNETGKDRCHYPGCSRARRPDPATGRPTRYCGQADPDGGPIHNPASAWRARQSQSGAVAAQEQVAAPVSLARATLEQRLAQLPEKVAEIREYLDAVVAGVQAAGDVEAAGAEVEDAHRDALTKITEADRRTAAAERTARLAGERADAAEQERAEADALVEDAMAELARVRDETSAEILRVRADAEAAVARAHEQLAEAQDQHRRALEERDAELERARQDATSSRIAAAAAEAAQEAADATAARERESAAGLRGELDQVRREADEARQRLQAAVDTARQTAQHAANETASVRAELATASAEAAAAQRAVGVEREAVASLTRELDRHRADAQAEREALRASHADQLAQAQRNTDERVQTLTEALTAAREVVAAYRAQLGAPEGPPQDTATTTRKRTQRAQPAKSVSSGEVGSQQKGPERD